MHEEAQPFEQAPCLPENTPDSVTPPHPIDNPSGPLLAKKTAHKLPSGAIVPYPDCKAAMVRGDLDVDSGEKQLQPKVDPSDPVDIKGIEGVVQTDRLLNAIMENPLGSPVATEKMAIREKDKRHSRPLVVFFAALCTLLCLGLILFFIMLYLNPSDEKKQAAASGGGTIIITTLQRVACTVALDGKAKGLLSPKGTLSLFNVNTGKHQIKITCPGFRTSLETVDVKPGEVTLLEPALKGEVQ
jgi:hypothetical protein